MITKGFVVKFFAWLCVAILVPLSLFSVARPAAPVPDEPIAISGFAFPESVIHDESADLYIVSNFGDLTPGNGFLSRIYPNGEVKEMQWITGLLQPKGLAIDGNVLYVSDVNAVRLFDRQTGEFLDEWPVPYVPYYNWLNDVAVGADGSVYATDSGLGMDENMNSIPTPGMALYRFDRKGNLSAMAQGLSLNGPNGIVLNGDSLFVCETFGNRIYRTNSSGKFWPVAEIPAYSLDGLVRLTDGTLLVSSWEPPGIFRIDPSRRTLTTVLDASFPYFYWDPNNFMGSAAPADIGFDYQRGRLLIPIPGTCTVVIYSLR